MTTNSFQGPFLAIPLWAVDLIKDYGQPRDLQILVGLVALMDRRQREVTDNPHTWKNLNMDMIQRFQDKYDSFLKTFDGFIVAHVDSFAMVYEKYNKPILMINSCRYDIPFCWTKDRFMLQKWKECLGRLNSHGLLTIVSNNKADQLYTTLGCGIHPSYIPSLCLYTNTTYTPTKSTFLVYNGSFSSHPLLTPKQDLPHPHQWSDITSFRGVVNFPYEVSLMSLFEQFTAGCPLFFPSKTYWKETQSISAYWGETLPPEFKPLSTQDAWIELADMYDVFQSPNTYYFDTEEHLIHLLETFEYKDDTEFRQAHIQRVKTQWKHVFQDIISKPFWSKSPRHLCYNRLPLLANVVYDIHYAGTGVTPQHTYPYHEPLTKGDVVFVKTDLLSWFLKNRTIEQPITLVTGVSDLSPSSEDTDRILNHPNIRKWIGCNITAQHPKLVKLPIGVGEPERINGNHDTLVHLHANRIPWDFKQNTICVPYHTQTHETRTLTATLPKLDFEDYMTHIGEHKFVICQRGNGYDTHRICEVLLMESVPIVIHSGLDDMYSQWPVLLVDSFEEVDTSSFVFDRTKYQAFLDVFWLSDRFRV